MVAGAEDKVFEGGQAMEGEGPNACCHSCSTMRLLCQSAIEHHSEGMEEGTMVQKDMQNGDHRYLTMIDLHMKHVNA